jgi:hypothetical protein
MSKYQVDVLEWFAVDQRGPMQRWIHKLLKRDGGDKVRVWALAHARSLPESYAVLLLEEPPTPAMLTADRISAIDYLTFDGGPTRQKSAAQECYSGLRQRFSRYVTEEGGKVLAEPAGEGEPAQGRTNV